jgi:hypothetical protein
MALSESSIFLLPGCRKDMIDKFNELSFVALQRDAQGNLVFAVEPSSP